MLSVAVLAIPVATGFAVLRYRLYDIDLVIGTAVKAGVLAGFVTMGYVAVVTIAGIVLGRAGPSDFVGSLVAMVVVALAFQPLRRRLGRMADRVVYGRRADPYEALARFSRSLAAHASNMRSASPFRRGLGRGNRGQRGSSSAVAARRSGHRHLAGGSLGNRVPRQRSASRYRMPGNSSGSWRCFFLPEVR